MDKLRVVFDVNVWVNALVGPNTEFPYLPVVPPTSANPSADCVSLAFDAESFTVFLSPHIMKNIFRVLVHLGVSEHWAKTAVEDIYDICLLSGGNAVEPFRQASNQKDFEDNLILDLLLATKSEVLVTSDAELLSATGWRGHAIVHPMDFVRLMLNR